ncbi:MAG: 3-hydroxyacyl-CoA dehydrogenase NAD-binding domain-containing protein [Desulfomonilaceae bacterium]
MSEVDYILDRKNMVASFIINTAGPISTIGQTFMTDMEKAINKANKDKVRGVVLSSAKKNSFLDGANLKELITDASPQSIRLAVIRYQDILAALAKSPFPVVAMLDAQTALGGGLELLLWGCDHVFATPGSKVGQPEVNVGLFPIGGATCTLTRVVGFKTAIEMITTGRVSSAESFINPAFLTMCSSADLKPLAKGWIDENQSVINRNYDPNFQEPDALPDEEKQKIINSARLRYMVCPDRPYLGAAIDCIEEGLKLSFEDAVRNGVEKFVPLLEHPNTRNKMDFFFLASGIAPRLAKADSSKAVNVDRMAIIGAGLMGRGIAQVAAERGIKTTLLDIDENVSRAAVENIDRTLERMVSKGRWTKARKEKVMGNIEWTTDYAELKKVPLVIECVFENLELKRKILSQVQDVNAELIFASNTSTIPMAHISEGARRPEQVVGMHFFSPVPLMPLLEVIKGAASSLSAVSTAVILGRTMGKTVILVNDGPGFYTSRTFGSFMNNGFRLAELGILPWDVDFLALQAGFPQGPLHLYGTTGGNVIYHANQFLASHFPDRIKVPESLTKLYGAGYVGAGRPSFYLDERILTRDESALEHIVPAKGLPVPERNEVKEILLLGMVNEAFWCLTDGVLPDYYSMDLGAVLGIGFPDCWHGPARYASLRGIKNVKARLMELSDKFELTSLTPAPEFDRLIACGLDSHLI